MLKDGENCQQSWTSTFGWKYLFESELWKSGKMSIDQPFGESNLRQSNVLDKNIDSKWTLKGESKRLDQSHSIGDKFWEDKTHCCIFEMEF